MHISGIALVAQGDSNGTQAPADYTDVQVHEDGTIVNVNYHTEVHNTIIIISGG